MTDVLTRFLKYVSFGTASDEDSESTPSAKSELALAEYLREELSSIGLSDAVLDEYGRVYAFLPETPGCEAAPFGLIAHMDTSPDAPGDGIKPAEVVYAGDDIRLREGRVLSPAEFPSLERYKGQKLIVTDGTTLLGADDKAGVAEIVTAMEYLAEHPQIRHGRIYVAFTPDEEIGRGADHFDRRRFAAEYAYTVDGGTLGEIEYENFNAASAKVLIHGVNIHPGDAKGRMKNAVLIGSELIGRLPAAETPANTEGYEGFYHVRSFNGNESEVRIDLIIRDHNREKFEGRKHYLETAGQELNERYGEGTVVIALSDTYYNMKEKIEPVLYIVDEAKKAMEEAGVEWKVVPIRGGTDGARLSWEGLPCPNLSTGGENFHSVYEYIPVRSLEKMTQVLTALCRR